MLTNVFRIGGLHQVSWFQLLPEGESLSPNSTRKERSWQDLAAMQVIRAHMWLQEQGNLSTWTLSDDRVKLWLFLPGRHDSLNPLVHSAVTGLKVVGAGVWRAPGECSEVASALVQALRNRIERGFRSMSYVRFGDVFVKCRVQGATELNLRKPLPSCELLFTASDDAIFVHVVVRRKRVRQLVMDDLQAALAQQRSNLGICDNSLAVIVAPSGLTARLSGCCPDDLVTQLYKSKLQAFNASTIPFHVVGSSSASGTSAAQHPCYAEVSLGQLPGSIGAARHTISGAEKKQVKRLSNGKDSGHVLIYPMDAVLVPMRPVVPCHTFLQRCWLREWAGTNWLEDGVDEEVVPSNSGRGINDGDGREKSTITAVDANGSGPTCSSGAGISSNSSGGSSSSSSSSHGSSGTSSFSDGDGDGDGGGEMEADAESLGSKAAGAVTSKRNNMRAPATPSQVLDSDVADMKNGTKRGRTKSMAGVATSDPPSKALKRSGSVGNDITGLMDGTMNDKRGAGYLGEPSGFGGGMSSSMGGGTPRESGSQLGNPWEQWDNDGGLGLGMNLGMDMGQSDADILAEFGDFGDFFEDDGLGFGEPPDTAESQMFPMPPEYGEVAQTPGTAPLDASDPMVLPILDFPFAEQLHAIDPLLDGSMKPLGYSENYPVPAGVQSTSPVLAVVPDSRLKDEASFYYAPGFEPIETTGVLDVCSAILRDPYIPEVKKSVSESPSGEQYVYCAIPPPTSKLEGSDGIKVEKSGNESPNEVEETKKKKEPDADYILVSGSHMAKQGSVIGQQLMKTESGAGLDGSAGIAQEAFNKRLLDVSGGGGNGLQIPGGAFTALSPSTTKNRGRKRTQGLSPVPVLATDVECALLQVLMCRSQDSSSSVSSNGYHSGVASPGNGMGRSTPVPGKDSNSEITQVQTDSLTQPGRGVAKPQQERRKKVPERIAGHADDDMHDGSNRAAQVGVWRPVGGPKSLQQPKSGSVNNSNAVDSRIVSNTTSPVDQGFDDLATGVAAARQCQWQEVLDALPLLAQQASVAVDVALDGHYGDGPLGWLASQELQRRQNMYGPGGSHVGYGGMLALTSCLDQSGVEIPNSLSAEISAATVASLLQSDVRVAMSNAFGEASADGPLALLDWCRGCVQASDCGESTNTDSREVNSTITVVGEPITPPQSGGGLKGMDMEDMRRSSSSNRAIDSSSLSEQTDACQRRGLVDDHSDVSGYHEPTILTLPTPALLVGYQDDWLKTSSSTLHLWEKAPLEPYALSKQVNYHVVCLASEPLVTAAVDFFQQLSSVYEVCRLGNHMPVGMVAGQSGPVASSSKPNLPGFTLVELPGVTYTPSREEYSSASSWSLAKSFVASMGENWSMDEYRKSLRKVCKSLSISPGSSTTQRDPEQGPCTVVYVVCPVSDPAGILQTMLDSCSSLGSAITSVEREQQAGMGGIEEDLLSNILGFSIPRFALQLVTAETIFKTSGPQVPAVDVLKEVALGVYNKVRRIPRRPHKNDSVQQPGVGGLGTRVRAGISAPAALQSNASLPGLWKDCTTQRSSGSANMSALDSASNLDTWEGGWKQSSMQTDAGTPSGESTHDAVRYLYEPAFILAEAGTPDAGVGLAPARTASRDGSRLQGDEASGSTHGASGVAGSVSDLGSNAMGDISDGDASASGQPAADLHCCYTWTEDWYWMISVWTDSRGELLDTQVLPLAGVDVQKEGAFQVLFGQVMQQGLQLLAMAVDAGSRKPRGLNITRLGGFYEKEAQEWHRVIQSMGGDDVRKWPVQIRHPHSDSSSSGGGAGSTSDMGLMTERALGLAGSGPASPSPSSSSFGGRGKTSAYKSGADLTSSLNRRQGAATNHMLAAEPAKGAFKWVHSISLLSVRVDQSLQIVSTTDGLPHRALSSVPSWPAGSSSSGAMGTGVNTVRTLASTGASFLVVPSHASRPVAPLSLPPFSGLPSGTELPSLAQCLQSSGPACPVTTAFAVSGATTSMVNDFVQRGMKEEWPSTLSVGLVALYSASSRLGSPIIQDVGPGNPKSFKCSVESNEQALEAHRALQVTAAELHSLSWLNVGLTCVHRRSPLPFHCEAAQRFQRLLDFLDAECGPSRPGLQV